MAQRTRGNVLLNAYMNRYMNDQAATVNSGQKDTATAASDGAKQIAAVPTNLPEVTNYSDEIYSGIIDRDKQSRDLYEQAVKVARKLAEDAAKEAAAAAEKAARAAKSSGGSSRRSSGSSKKSGGSSSKSGGAATTQAQLPAKSAAQSKSADAKTAETALAPAKASKGQRTTGKNAAKSSKKTVAAVQKELDEKQAAAKAAQKEGTRYAAQVGRGATAQSTDVGLASSYGAGAQAHAAREAVTAPREREQERREQQSRTREVQRRKEAYRAQRDAQRKTTLANLQADPEYARQLSQPGVRLTQTEIDAVQEYLDDQGSDYAYSRDVYDRMNRGEITREDADALLSDRSALKNKVSFGGLGQDLQAFTAGIYNSVPFLAQIMEGYEDWADDATGGQYEKITGGRTMTDVLENTEQQNALAGTAGRFAGNAALYGAANSALAGTRFAGAAATAGEKAANALRSVPGVSNLVTPGTGRAIGNILTGQSVDLALDTVPSLVSDLYDYNTGNEEGLTPGDIAARTAGNFGVNLAMNVGAEALPSIVRGVRSGIEDTVNAVRPRETAEQAESLVRAYESNVRGGTAQMSADALNREMAQSLPALDVGDDVQGAGFLTEPLTEVPDALRVDAYDTGAYMGRPSAEGTVYAADVRNADEPAVYVPRYNDVVQETVMQREQPVPAPVQNAVFPDAGSSAPAAETAANVQNAGLPDVGSAPPAAEPTTSAAGSRAAQMVTGRSRRSPYTREAERIFARIEAGEPIENLRADAQRIAEAVYRPADFAQTIDVDPAARELRNYLRDTQIKLGDREAGELLSASGTKSLTEYNRQNGTRFSRNGGLDWDVAMQELGEMNVGVNDTSIDGLMRAVKQSHQRAERVVDEDLYHSFLDYAKDSLLRKREYVDPFEDWLDDMVMWGRRDEIPEYLRRVYARMENGQLDLPESARTAGLPEVGIGAKRQELPVGEVVPNRDYAAQAAARGALDEEHAAAVETFEHQAWTDKEAQRQALEDINTAIQSNEGNFDAGAEAIIQNLRETKDWDKGNIVTAQELRNRLRTQFQQTEPGTPEFYRQQARYNELVGMESDQLSKAGQNLQAGSMDAQRRINLTARQIGSQFEKQNPRQAKRIAELEEELDRLRQALDARNQADMDAVDGLRGAFDDAKAPATDMDKEFGEFLETQGIATDPTEQFNALVAQIKKMCEDKGVAVSDDGAKKIAGMIQTGAAKENYYDKLVNEAMGVTDLSLDEMAMVDDLYSKASQLPDSKERYQLEQQAIAIMANHLPARTWFEKLDNIRYLAMLGNTRTHARNLIGNVLMSAVSKGKDEVSAALQLMLPQNQRTRALYTPREMKDAAREYMNENVYSTLRTGGRYNLDQGIDRARKTYGDSLVGKALQKLSDLNSNALEKEDEIFLQSAFVRSLAGNLTAKGFDPSIFSATDDASKAVLANAVEMAVRDAKDATFRADNTLTKVLGQIGNLGDKRGNAGEKLGYIMSSGLLPFTKTPANILKTSLEYTPVGGVVEAVSRGARAQGAAEVMDALAKGTVGTGLIGLGWYLADAGLVTAKQDEDAEKYGETTGVQNYSVRIPGVGSYTVDWASPSAVPFLIGASLGEDGADLSALLDDPGQFAGQFADIMASALDPVTEMSLLSSVEDTLDAVRYSDDDALLGIGADVATGYFQQFVPTLFGQVARSVDPIRRSTYGGGESSTERDLNYQLQSAANKIPGLSQNAEPYIDQWGRTEASLDGTGGDALGVAGRLAYNMLSPGYFSESSWSHAYQA